MAAVPIQIDGVLWDHAWKSARKVSLIGQGYLIGLSVGGGPIIPPDAPPDGGPPTEPPVDPPDPEPPPVTVAIKPPPEGGGWGWIAPYGWAYFPMTGAAGPK